MNTLLNRATRAVALATVTAVGASTLVLGGASPAAAEPPAVNASQWLVSQLTDGIVVNEQYSTPEYPSPDYGLTIDVAFALRGTGGQEATVGLIRDRFAPHIGAYTEYAFAPTPEQTHIFAGGVAKALAFAQMAGADGSSYGGRNLVADLEARTAASGRIEDKLANDVNLVEPGDQADTDFANVIGQAFAARGLALAGSAEAGSALSYLLQQQCPAGFFRLNFAAQGAPEQGCQAGAAGSEPDTDVTGLAVLNLVALNSASPDVKQAIGKASAWLAAQQRANGSFGGGPTTSASNANSTGVAGWALATQGDCVAAGRAGAWLKTMQAVPGTSAALNSDQGAVAYDENALVAGKTAGITAATSDQWRRATAQAAPALVHALGGSAATTLDGPKSYQRAGSTVTLRLGGIETAERACLSGPGITGVRTLVSTGAPVTTSVVLPTTTGAATYAAVTATGTKTFAVSVLGKTTLVAKAKKKKVHRGERQVVKVRGLAPGEKTRVKVRKKLVSSGKANARGVYKARFVVGKKIGKPGKAKVKVTGQFKDLRKGTTHFRVVR